MSWFRAPASFDLAREAGVLHVAPGTFHPFACVYRRPVAAQESLPSDRTELDELTLARARRGDRSAAGALIRIYERPVFALLSRMLIGSRHRALCEDLAQETFLRALRALPEFDPAGRAKLSTWLLTIAARLAINEMRRKEFPLDTRALLEEAPAPAGINPSERRELAAAIERAIGELPPVYRAAFLLREVHELAYEEIATALEIDLGTVRSRLARARARLQEALRGLEEQTR